MVYVWNTLRRLGVPEPDRDDLVQQVFLTVHDLLDDYDSERHFRPWVFAIAYRIVLRHRRSRARSREDAAPPEHLEARAGSADSSSAHDAREVVAVALESIDIHRRAVFLMKELDGHDVPEIAEALGIPLNTAYSRLRLARDEFRQAVARIENRDMPEAGGR